MRTAAFQGISALLFLFSAVACGQTASPDPIRLYVYEFNLSGLGPSNAGATFEAIAKAVQPRPLEIRSVQSLEALEESIREKQADIVIAGAAVYRKHLQNGMRDVATLATDLQPNPDHAVGALILVRNESTITSLEELHGTSIGVTSTNEFRDFLILAKEVNDLGFDYRKFFGTVKSFNRQPAERLAALRRGDIDAAVVNVCWVESHSHVGMDPLSGLKPIALKPSGETKCMTSTDLYPNWSVLVSASLNGSEIVRIADAILRMPSLDGNCWTIASDFRSVDEVYRSLRTGPYEYLNSWTLERVWQEFWFLICMVMLTLIFGVWHAFRTQHLVAVRTAQLKAALAEQRKLSMLSAEQEKRYEKVRHALTVSRFSSMVAHEVSQPLASILLYVGGLQRLIRRKADEYEFDAEDLQKGVDNIFNQAKKANQIIRMVRSFAKSNEQNYRPINLSVLIPETVNQFVLSGKLSPDAVHLNLADNLWIRGASQEIDVAIGNLLKNSIEALSETKHPEIYIESKRTSDKFVEIAIKDNGPPIGCSTISKIKAEIGSSKPEGLGLGLSIIQSIMERHSGRLTIDVDPAGRFFAILLFPLWEAER